MNESNSELSAPFQEEPKEEFKPWGMKEKDFIVLMHVSVFMAGIILPIVMWSQFKDENEEIDKHGKDIINWGISSILYFFLSFILTFLFVGIFTTFAVGICATIFPIIGAIKASNGEHWKYPLNIGFIK